VTGGRRRGSGAVIPRRANEPQHPDHSRPFFHDHEAVIPRRANEPQHRTFDRETERERNRIERLINRRKQHRAIATRSDTLTVSYHAMLTFACILIWL
jgi:transposase